MRFIPYTLISTLACLLLAPLLSKAEPEVRRAIDPDDAWNFPYGYPFPEYPMAGGSHPGRSHDYMAREPRPGDIKRLGQYVLRLLQTEREAEALEFATRYLREHPGRHDAEMLFVKTLAQTRLGALDEAAESMRKAIEEADLPPARFIAGPRRLFEPLHSHEAFQELLAKHRNDLVHGPMLGRMTDSGVSVWVRTVDETEVWVAVSRSPDMSNPKVFGPVSSRAGDDFTAEVDVVGLQADTEYHYAVKLGEDRTVVRAAHQHFRTSPLAGKPATFQVVFGGCAGFDGLERERIWDTITDLDPSAVLMLGDNVYIDDPESPDQQQYCYYQRYSVPSYRRMVGSSPIYAIWDDHDFGMDDSEGGPEVNIPYWKPMVFDIFKHNFVNPAYGASPERPGVWFDFHIGDVHFIMLDGRYYREDGGRWSGGEGVENPSMLGPHQLAWLKETLTQSEATFKVLVSPVPWKYAAKGEGIRKYDGWYGYREERDKIFSWIDAFDVSGVVLLSGDRHRSDAYRIEREGAYDLYEFSSAQFTNIHTHGLIDVSLVGYNEKNSFGSLTFNTESEDPSVLYEIINVDGEVKGHLELKSSQLRPSGLNGAHSSR